MSLVFLCLKAIQLVDYPDDYWRGLVLVALDLIWVAEWTRIWMHVKGR